MKLRTLLLGLVLLGVGIAVGYGISRVQPEKEKSHPKSAGGQNEGGNRAKQKSAAKLQSLPYLSGHEPAPKKTGVLVYDEQRSAPGYNFYLSAHADEATLMDMRGKTLHTWHSEFGELWPDRDLSRVSPAPHWRRAHLFPNGDLLAIYERLGLVKLDSNSGVLWKRAGGFHHDMQVMKDGTIYALLYRAKAHPRFRTPDPRMQTIDEDFVAILDSEGKLLREVSLVDAFLNSDYASFLFRVPMTADIFHTNTLEVLDGRLEDQAPAFRRGNVLISLRTLDVIAVVDLEAEKVVWALSGLWRMQHHPTILANGNLLLFDNLGHRGYSKVIEMNPFTQEIVWTYEGDDENRFRSTLRGANQRLPNGNTLITDSNNGRAFEVTAEKEIVWEFVNPKRARNDERLIAVLYELLRLPPEAPLDWLKPTDSQKQPAE